jgi:histidyl-tRNA synthetase
MALATSRPRGTEDVLPTQVGQWQMVEAAARDLARVYGYGEIRTPIFEHSELIHRVGESTDVVQKEMYELIDRSGRKLTLRPEGTAPVARACLQANLFAQGLPVKVCYVNYAAFRYERPEAGRLREHHQFGCEVFGSPNPETDAELMLLLGAFLSKVGVRRASAHVNSIGCAQCRPTYRQALQGYYADHLNDVCEDCKRRYRENPLRLLDCKVDRGLALAAPHSADYLCADCRTHLDRLQLLLDANGLAYTLDPMLVRGFDYYTRTVFEFVHGGLGSQSGLGGGGRYDGLVESLGGPALPAAGFGIGIERLLLAVEQDRQGPEAAHHVVDVFVTATDTGPALAMCQWLRGQGIRCDFDLLGRSLKAQFKHADRLGAAVVVHLGEQESQLGEVAVRSMVTGQQRTVARDALLALLQTMLGARREGGAGE